MNNNYLRIIFSVILLVAVFIFPWWVITPLAILGTFFFSSFYEVILVGFMMDRLYGIYDDNFLRTFPLTISAMIIFLLSFWVREHIRLGQK